MKTTDVFSGSNPDQTVLELASMASEIPVVELPEQGGTTVEIATATSDPDTKMPVKKHVLSAEAHNHRQHLVKTQPKMRGVCSAISVEKAFEGRGENPVPLDEFKGWVDAQIAAKAAAPKLFTNEAYANVVARNHDLARELFLLFPDRYDVGAEEVALKVAEIRVSREIANNVQIDGAPTTCANEKCGSIFVPLSHQFFVGAKEDGNLITSGQYFAVNGEVKVLCGTCKGIAITEAKKAGRKFYFFSRADADEKAGGQANAIDRQNVRQERRDERREGVLGTIGDALRGGRDQQRGGGQDDRRGKQAGKFNSQLAARFGHNYFHTLLERDANPDLGMYYSPEFEWKDRDGVAVKSFLHLDVGKYGIKVIGAGRGLEAFIGDQYNWGGAPKPVVAAMFKAAAAQSGE